MTTRKARRLWIKALRSGVYEQARNALGVETRDGGTAYCCLGVACEVAIEAGVPVTKSVSDDGNIVYDGDDAVLPERVQDFMGLSASTGQFERDYTMPGSSLAELNDDGYTFNQIAAIIETEPKGLIA